VLLLVRSNVEDYIRPQWFASSNKCEDFAVLSLKTTLSEMAMKMEGYMMSGIEGNYITITCMVVVVTISKA
jgi:hypothetical protein